MPPIQRSAAPDVAGGPARGLSPTTLDHLGRLLRDACAPGETTGFADLLSRLEAALAGTGPDEAAFRDGLLRSMPSLHRFAVSLARDQAAADDLVQDTLLRGWRARAGFTPGTNLEAWLFTILRNVFYSAHRKQGREVTVGDDTYADRLASVPEQGGHLDLQDVRAALDRLAAPMREALVLVAIQDLSYEDAAAVMGCRIGTVKSRVWRARDQLVRALGYTGAEVGTDALIASAMEGAA